MPRIATALSCNEQTVRQAIHAFNQQGRAAVQAESSHPHHLTTVLRGDITAKMVTALLHRSPREFAFPTSEWTIEGLVQQSVRLGRLVRLASIEAMRLMLCRVGIQWKRAKHGLPAPNPGIGKKTAWDRLLRWVRQAPQAATWAIGFMDEVWWSRFALPNACAWQAPVQPLRLVEQPWQKG